MKKNEKQNTKLIQNVRKTEEKPERTRIVKAAADRIVMLPVSEVRPYERNPRKNADAVKYVKASIEKFGFKVPIVIDSNRVVVCGHTRLLAAKSLGMTEVPCIMADDLTEDQVKAFRLADNKVGEFAEWDMDLLGDELYSIDIDMTAFGFDLFSKKEVIEDDFNPEPPEEPKSKLGEIYQLGRHRLMCGDSTSMGDVRKLTGGALVDLLLTDPPYNVDYQGVAGKIKNDSMESSKFRAFLRDAFEAAKSVMRRGGCFTCGMLKPKATTFVVLLLTLDFSVGRCLFG